ncbi:YchJ family protein [Allochromatium vinosum]|uniref:YchJ family protein n=1 Tax=Allochromatium vinosum TaxID=1049 RepID=UPI00190868EE|nr:YchJ family metal-binding protein [Allochromatium vinosum]MBK1655890.1 preprotein translocase subunit SecA [Allochromatium vinosum]
MPDSTCPCGSGRPFDDCCDPHLSGRTIPPTAEALMRSRYSAFATGQADYLLATWHPTTRPATLTLEPGLRWLGLKILGTEAGGEGDQEGWVTFVARSKFQGRAQRLQERSRFVREHGRWFYVDGELS